jgi:hypothetical protein
MKPGYAGTLALACLFVGCAARKEFVQTGGGPSEGYVTISSELSDWEGLPDREQGLALATSKCVGWGYKGALQYGEAEFCYSAWHGRLFGPFTLCYRNELVIQYYCEGASTLPPQNDLVPSF